MEKLVNDIQRIFVEDKINTEDIRKVLEAYTSDPKDWKKYAHFDAYKYTRNLVDVGNGKYNLMILCWGPGMGSSIHDHTDSHCFVKVLDGELLETRFAWPHQPKKIDGEDEGGKKEIGAELFEDCPLEEIGSDKYHVNEVTYINDQIGLHRMENPSHSSPAVTLHLYIPPYSSCYAFDQRTGRKQKATVTFYTKYGKKVDYSGCKEGHISTTAAEFPPQMPASLMAAITQSQAMMAVTK